MKGHSARNSRRSFNNAIHGTFEGLEVRHLFSVDLSASLGTVTVPASQTSGAGTSNNIQLKVFNLGDTTTAKTEKGTITVAAIPTGGGSSISVFTNNNQSLGNIAPTKFMTIPLKFSLPTSVTTGSYSFLVTVTDNTADVNSANDSITPSTQTNVTGGFIDFSTGIVSTTAPASIVTGANASVTVRAKTTNIGNIVSSKAEKGTITLVAHPTGGGSDVPLQTLANQSLANIKPNALKNFTLKGSLAGLAAGTYQLVVTTTDSADAQSGNDSATSVGTIVVASAFVDLKVDSATATFASSVAGGATGSATVSVKNIGNSAATGYRVDVFATTDGNIPEGASPIGTTQSATAKIAPGATLKIKVNTTLPAPVGATDYSLVALVTFNGDTNSANDHAAVSTVHVSATPPFLGDLLNSYILHQTTFNNLLNIQITSTGNLSDGNGTSLSDGYSYVVTNGPVKVPAHLSIVHNVTPTDFQLTFNGATPNSLDGKKIIFQKSSAGATGKFKCLANAAVGIPNDVTGFFVIV